MDLNYCLPWKERLAQFDAEKRVPVVVLNPFVVQEMNPDFPGIRGRTANVGETVKVPLYLLADLQARGLAEPAN